MTYTPNDPTELIAKVKEAKLDQFLGHVICSSLEALHHIWPHIQPNANKLPPNWKRSYFIVETDERRAEYVTRHFDMGHIVNNPDVYLFVGPNGVDKLRKFLAYPEIALPTINIETDEPTLRAVYDESQRRHASMQFYVAQMERLNEADFKHEKERIMFITSVHTSVVQYVVEELHRAAQELGYESFVLK